MIAMDDPPGVAERGRCGGGAVVPLLPDDLSMGLHSDKRSFWLNLRGDEGPVAEGARAACRSTSAVEPCDVRGQAVHTTYAAGMGYDILRLHGTKVNGTVTARRAEKHTSRRCAFKPRRHRGTGGSPPDSSYMDWFLLTFRPPSRRVRPDRGKSETFSTFPCPGWLVPRCGISAPGASLGSVEKLASHRQGSTRRKPRCAPADVQRPHAKRPNEHQVDR